MLKEPRLPDASLYLRDLPPDGVPLDCHTQFVRDVHSTDRESSRAQASGRLRSDSTPKGESNVSAARLQTPQSDKDTIGTEALISQIETNSVESEKRPEAPDEHSEWVPAIPIPGSRKRNLLYLNAKVETPSCNTTICNQKFGYYCGLMEAAINSRQHIRDDVKLRKTTSYNLHMVGTTRETAKPSVVVFCRKEYFKDLRSLFGQRLHNQLHCDARSFLGLLRMHRNEKQLDEKFDLVYFCVDVDPVDRKASEDTLTAHFETTATWCGGLAMSESRTSTLGLAIYAPDFLGVLTVDHLFVPPVTPDYIKRSQPGEILSDVADSLGTQPDVNLQQEMVELWLDDTDEYDLEDVTSEADATIREETTSKATQSMSKQRPHIVPEEWHRVVPKPLPGDQIPYLDWALVRPGPGIGMPCLPNIVFPNGPDESPITLDKVFEESPVHRAGVSIISGVRGFLKGHILASNCILGSMPQYGICEAWTVILDSGVDDLLEGECGSLVIDQRSNEVYGHVVACGPLGQVYVAPMKQVLGQIKDCFEVPEVRVISNQLLGREAIREQAQQQDSAGPANRPTTDEQVAQDQIRKAVEEAVKSKQPIPAPGDLKKFVKDLNLDAGAKSCEKQENVKLDMWLQRQNSCLPTPAESCDTRYSPDSDANDIPKRQLSPLPSPEAEAPRGFSFISQPNKAQSAHVSLIQPEEEEIQREEENKQEAAAEEADEDTVGEDTMDEDAVDEDTMDEEADAQEEEEETGPCSPSRKRPGHFAETLNGKKKRWED